jgi:hypothetical protein
VLPMRSERQLLSSLAYLMRRARHRWAKTSAPITSTAADVESCVADPDAFNTLPTVHTAAPAQTKIAIIQKIDRSSLCPFIVPFLSA